MCGFFRNRLFYNSIYDRPFVKILRYGLTSIIFLYNQYIFLKITYVQNYSETCRPATY